MRSFIAAWIVLGLALAGTAGAENIAFNWAGFGGALSTIADGTDAGFVSNSHWNNATVDSQSNGITGSLSNLVNSAGSATTLDVAWTNNGNNWVGSTTPTSGNQSLFRSYMRPVTGTMTITVSEVPYALYDVYVYVGLHVAPRAGTVGKDGATTPFRVKEASTWTSWQEIVNSGDTGNYIVYKNQTGTSFTLTIANGGISGVTSGGGINGFQVVQVPEPGTTALLIGGAAGLVLCGWRRRR